MLNIRVSSGLVGWVSVNVTPSTMVHAVNAVTMSPGEAGLSNPARVILRLVFFDA